MLSGFVALPVRHLICALRSRPQAVAEYQSQVLAWLNGCLDDLELLRPIVIRSQSKASIESQVTQGSDDLFHQAELDLKKALEVLTNQELFSEEQADGLEEAVVRFYGQLFQLQLLEIKRPAFSPMLVVDQFIKVAFNVLQGACPVWELQTRFPPVQAEVANWRVLVKARQELYPEVAWSRLEEPLRQIEGGLGALSQFLEQGIPLQLERAVQLLGKGSADFVSAHQSLENDSASPPRFSPHQAIEFWLRLQEHPEDLGEMVTHRAWDRLFQEVDDLLRSLQIAQRAGLAIVHPDLLAEAARVHQQAFDHLAALAANPQPSQAVAERLNPLWDRLAQARQTVVAALGDLQSRFGGSPRMLELLEMLGQAATGLLAPWALQSELQQRLQQHQTSLQALREAPQASESILPLLASHQQAFQRMLLFCEDEQVAHLVEGWKVIALTLPPLLALESQLRLEVSNKGKAQQQITCIRCGHVQKQQKICAQCGGSLPYFQLQDVQYEVISGGSTSGGKVQVADALSDLIQGLAFGASNWGHVSQEIQQQLESLARTREGFEKELVKMLGGGAEALDIYSQFFVVRLGQLTQVLLEMEKSARVRDITTLTGQLSSYRELHEELAEFQKRVASGLETIP